MFEESLVESTPLLRTRNRGPLLTSFAVQAALAAALIAIPMLHPEIIHLRAPRLTLIAPPMARPTPPPPPVHVEASTSSSSAATTAPATQPTRISSLIRQLDTNPVDIPAIGIVGMNTTTPGLPVGVSSVPVGPHVSVAPAANTHTGPIPVSSGVTAGLLINPIQPVYPSIAKAAGVQGTVVVQAIISTTGHIESAHAVSGPIMLQPAALDAVRNARYRPYLLNHQPTTVETTITINFKLGS
jgi:protein TonB